MSEELSLRRFLWPRHPRTEAGLAVGMAWLVRSTAPTLLPRDTTRAVLVSGLSGTAGFLVGDALMPLRSYHGLGEGTLHHNDRRRLAAYALTVGVGATCRSLPDRALGSTATRQRVRAVGNLLTMGAPEIGAVLATRTGEAVLQHRLGHGWAVPAAAGVGVAFLAAHSLRRSRRGDLAQRDERSPDPPNVTAGLAGAAAVAGALVGTAAAHESAVNVASRRIASRLDLSEPWIRRTLMALSAGSVLWSGTALKQARYAALELQNDGLEDGFSQTPQTPYVSGGPGSRVAFATMGMQGRRFVSLRPDAATICTTLGEAALEPIRIFVGVRSGRGLGQRVDLALAELERSGAFEREVLVLASPAGTGYTNSIATEAIELLQRGDVATVSLQYAARPSVLSIDEVPRAGDQYRYLVDRVSRALAERPAEGRPRLVVYGESLGARTSQQAFVGRGTAGIQASGIDRVLWVGTPGGSEWAIEAFEQHHPDVDHSTVLRVTSGADLATVPDARLASTTVLMLDHDNDPIPLFRPSLLAVEPPWCAAPRRAGSTVPPVRWRPIVTGLQVGIDTLGATNVVPGEFDAYAHDYRADLAQACLYGLRLRPVTDEQLSRVQERLRESEVAAARRIEAQP